MDIVDFGENLLGLTLMEHQKTFLTELKKRPKPISIYIDILKDNGYNKVFRNCVRTMMMSSYGINPKGVRVMEDWSKHEPRFRYMMLDRLRQDCNYYLGYGGRNPNSLWAGDEKRQIQTMKDIWNTFPKEDTPEWLTWEDILEFERKMCQ